MVVTKAATGLSYLILKDRASIGLFFCAKESDAKSNIWNSVMDILVFMNHLLISGD